MITTQQLQLLKEGNKKAFEALYRAYNARIYSFVLSMIGDAGVAKDITQDIFLQIWEKRLNIDLEGNFDGYLFKISQNMVYHYVRRELLLQNYVDKLSNESADESVEIDEELDYFETGILQVSRIKEGAVREGAKRRNRHIEQHVTCFLYIKVHTYIKAVFKERHI